MQDWSRYEPVLHGGIGLMLTSNPQKTGSYTSKQKTTHGCINVVFGWRISLCRLGSGGERLITRFRGIP